MCGQEDEAAEFVCARALDMVRDQPGPEKADLLARLGTVAVNDGDPEACGTDAPGVTRTAAAKQMELRMKLLVVAEPLGNTAAYLRRYEEATMVYEARHWNALIRLETPLRPR